MSTKVEDQHIVPKKFEGTRSKFLYSFKEALQVVESNEEANKEILFYRSFELTENEKRFLMQLPKAFGMNRTIRQINFTSLEVEHILVADAFKAGIRKDEVISVRFEHCLASDLRLMERMCEGFKERSRQFELNLYSCSPEFANPVIEACYMKCFSLSISWTDCSVNKVALKTLFLKGNLYYIDLYNVEGLKEASFLQIGRCLTPRLTELSLNFTAVPISALKRLLGFLKEILDSGKTNGLESLALGATEVGSKLSFAYFRLLRYDAFKSFIITVREDVSRAVVKSICSNVASTKNLKVLSFLNNFCSPTKFKSFNLQEENYAFAYPYGVNPTVA